MGGSPDWQPWAAPVASERAESREGDVELCRAPGLMPVAELPTGTLVPPARRVLHVERDTFLAALYHATLEDAGFDVDWFPSADAALRATAPAAYDVCLLEADLPAARGRTTAETVAELARGASVLILAGELEAEIDTTGVLNLSKPFPPHALVQAVESASLTRRRAA